MKESRSSRPDISRVVILGHSGFIGSHVVKAVAADWPDVEIVGRSRPPLDLTVQAEADALGSEFDRRTALVMCAAIKRQLGDSLDAFDLNLRMVTNLCRVIERQPVGRVIFFSSAAVYGEETENVRIAEETPVNPTSYYGIAKFAAERVLQKALADSDTPVAILRPPLVYGPGDQAMYGPSGFVKSALRGVTIQLWGDGSELREFVYVHDVARLVSMLVRSTFEGVLNVASGANHSFADSIAALQGLMTPVAVEQRERSRSKVDNRFTGTRIREIFPEIRFTPLEEGMRLTLENERQSANPIS